MPETSALPTMIRFARLSAGLSQAQMAEQMCLSQGYISQIEAGTRTPSLRVLRLAAKTTGVTLSQLIDEPGER